MCDTDLNAWINANKLLKNDFETCLDVVGTYVRNIDTWEVLCLRYSWNRQVQAWLISIVSYKLPYRWEIIVTSTILHSEGSIDYSKNIQIQICTSILFPLRNGFAWLFLELWKVINRRQRTIYCKNCRFIQVPFMGVDLFNNTVYTQYLDSKIIYLWR